MTNTNMHVKYSAEGTVIRSESSLVRFDSAPDDCRLCMYVRRFGQGKQILASVPAVLQNQDSIMEIKLISYLHLLLKLEKQFFSYQGIFLQA